MGKIESVKDTSGHTSSFWKALFTILISVGCCIAYITYTVFSAYVCLGLLVAIAVASYFVLQKLDKKPEYVINFARIEYSWVAKLKLCVFVVSAFLIVETIGVSSKAISTGDYSAPVSLTIATIVLIVLMVSNFRNFKSINNVFMQLDDLNKDEEYLVDEKIIINEQD